MNVLEVPLLVYCLVFRQLSETNTLKIVGSRYLQFNGVYKLSTSITLISSGILQEIITIFFTDYMYTEMFLKILITTKPRYFFRQVPTGD